MKNKNREKKLGEYTGLPVTAYIRDPHVMKVLEDLLSGGSTVTLQQVTEGGNTTNFPMGFEDSAGNINISLEPDVSDKGVVTVREAPSAGDYKEAKLETSRVRFINNNGGGTYTTILQPSSALSNETFTLPSGLTNATIATMQSQVVQLTGDHTAVADNVGKVLVFDSATPVNLTIPAALNYNFNCLVIQKGAGAVNFVASGTTINNRQGFTKTAGQWAIATLAGESNNSFVISGDLTA